MELVLRHCVDAQALHDLFLPASNVSPQSNHYYILLTIRRVELDWSVPS